MINLISYDGENHGDILGTIGASAALLISDIPWDGPVASVRIGRIDGEFIINPTISQLETSDMEIIISGTKESIVIASDEITVLESLKPSRVDAVNGNPL